MSPGIQLKWCSHENYEKHSSDPREGVGFCGRATIGIFSCKLKKNHKPVPDEIHRPRQRDLDISLNGVESYCIELTYHRRTKEKKHPH